MSVCVCVWGEVCEYVCERAHMCVFMCACVCTCVSMSVCAWERERESVCVLSVCLLFVPRHSFPFDQGQEQTCFVCWLTVAGLSLQTRGK